MSGPSKGVGVAAPKTERQKKKRYREPIKAKVPSQSPKVGLVRDSEGFRIVTSQPKRKALEDITDKTPMTRRVGRPPNLPIAEPGQRSVYLPTTSQPVGRPDVGMSDVVQVPSTQ